MDKEVKELVESVQSTVSKSGDMLEKVYGTVEQMIVKYSQPATELVLSVVQLQATVKVSVFCVLFLVCLWLFVGAGRRLITIINNTTELKRRHHLPYNDKQSIGYSDYRTAVTEAEQFLVPRVITLGVSGFGLCVMTLVGLIQWATILGVYDPKFYIAYQLVTKFL